MLTDARVEVAVELDMSLGESPLWSVARQTLHWVDINHGVIYAWQPGQDEAPSCIELDEKVGCIALCEEGLLAATASGIIRLWLPFDGRTERLADNPEWHNDEGNRFNDGRRDAAGRLWAGTIAADEASPTATLYITTATQHLDDQDMARWPWAGSLLAMSASTAGLMEPG